MNELIIASHNQGKICEYKAFFPQYKFFGLNELNYQEEIKEMADSFEKNALYKAQVIFEHFQKPTISDDSGLLINALPGALGVRTKRFSKTGMSEDNIDLLLKKLEAKQNRTAIFKSVICLYLSAEEYYFFTGETFGEITKERRGERGFAYDSVFLVSELNKTYAELSLAEKNKVSHRAKAMTKLSRYLNEKNLSL